MVSAATPRSSRCRVRSAPTWCPSQRWNGTTSSRRCSRWPPGRTSCAKRTWPTPSAIGESDGRSRAPVPAAPSASITTTAPSLASPYPAGVGPWRLRTLRPCSPPPCTHTCGRTLLDPHPVFLRRSGGESIRHPSVDDQAPRPQVSTASGRPWGYIGAGRGACSTICPLRVAVFRFLSPDFAQPDFLATMSASALVPLEQHFWSLASSEAIRRLQPRPATRANLIGTPGPGHQRHRGTHRARCCAYSYPESFDDSVASSSSRRFVRSARRPVPGEDGLAVMRPGCRASSPRSAPNRLFDFQHSSTEATSFQPPRTHPSSAQARQIRPPWACCPFRFRGIVAFAVDRRADFAAAIGRK